jgi:Ran GTPase-activating protein (RanGAP) involved in mRNA processing and transport
LLRSLSGNRLGAEGAAALAPALAANGGLTSINLSNNQLCGVWTDYRGQHGTHTAEGITAIADAMRMRVNGGLTVTNLLGNQLDAEAAKMLAEVAKQKGISLCGIQRDQTIADFSNQCLGEVDAILLGSDLSQAVVTGELTNLRVLCNRIGAAGERAVRDAVKDRSGFELDL